MRRVDSLEKTLMLGGIGGRRRRGRQRMRWLDGITDSMDVESEWTPEVGDGQGGLACCDSWGGRVGHDWAAELTELNAIFEYTVCVLRIWCVCLVCSVAQLCPTLCNPVDCNPPGSSFHGIFQARTLVSVAISFSRGSSQPTDWTRISCVSRIGRWILYH